MFCCNVNRITECNISNTSNSSNSKILLYKVIMRCPSPDHGQYELSEGLCYLEVLCDGNSNVDGKRIVPFHKDFSHSGEQLEHRKLAHEL